MKFLATLRETSSYSLSITIPKTIVKYLNLKAGQTEQFDITKEEELK